MRKSLLVVLLGLSAVIFACSSKSGDDNSGSPNTPQTNSETTNDGTEPGTPSSESPVTVTDSGTKQDAAQDAGPKVPTNQAECLAACVAKHPEGKVKADAIAACWTASCNPSCTMMPDRLDHNVSPADAGATCGVPELPILVPSQGCAECTQTNCCTQWAECFSGLQADCTLLNQCASDCWTQFKQ